MAWVTYILLFMLYAAYPRMTAEVNVQTAKVRAWRAVTDVSRDERRLKMETESGIPEVGDTLLYIRRVNLRVTRFWAKLKTAIVATMSCQ